MDKTALEMVFHALIVSLTGLPGALVRPMRQAEGGPSVPEKSVTWAAFGFTGFSSQGFPSLTQAGEKSRLDTYRDLTLLVSFYGPEAQDLARLCDDGLYTSAHRAVLRQNGLAFVRREGLVLMPEPSPAGWLERADLLLQFTLHSRREYDQPSLLSADVGIKTDKGLSVEQETV
jgi:hypothetical protein